MRRNTYTSATESGLRAQPEQTRRALAANLRVAEMIVDRGIK
jgi:hypothetical protein